MANPWSELSPETSLREAREVYLSANGFRIEDYEAPSFRFRALGRDWTFRNPSARRRAIPLHDLHHVLTGYDTDLRGEAEIGAWELAAGCNTFFLYVINGGAVLSGLLIAPIRTLRAGWRGRRAKTLYVNGQNYERLLERSIAEVRAELNIPEKGLNAQ